MKKKLTAVLLLVVLLLTGCADAVETITTPTPGTTPANPPSESTTSTSNESSIPSGPVPAWQDRVQQLNALYGEEAVRLNMDRVILSDGSAVTASREADGDLSLLADGREMSVSTREGAVNFAGKDELVLTLDMGYVKDGIFDIGLGMLYATELNAGLPESVRFFISKDGENFLLVGTVYSDSKAKNNTRSVLELRLQNYICARYIKAVIAAEDISFDTLCIDEMYAYSYIEGQTQDAAYDKYYQNPPLPPVVEDLHWNRSEADYQDEINLVAGKSYRIQSTLPIESSLQTAYYNSPITNKALTDGTIGSSNFSDGAYFHFTRAAERTVFFDLEKVSGVTSVTVGFLSNPNVGITLPEVVTVTGSKNGNEWGEIAVDAPTTTRTDSHRVNFVLTFEKTETRFVAVKFSFNSHLWIDEITVNGTKSIEGAAELKLSAGTNEYLSPDALGGVENIMLMYTFKNENPSVGLNTVEELLPYVAYHNAQGEIKDTFFDSFLFLPCSTTCPSGGHLYYDANKPSRASDWLLFEEDLFDKGANVPALSQAVTAMDEALGTDTEMSVFLSVFSTVYGDTGFGDIEGELNGVDFHTIEDRKKVIVWWIDRMVARMESGNYGNLRLDGFYWYHEIIEAHDPHEIELVKFTADYVHSLGYYFIWIPYYQANGFNNWKSYGFDAAVMQPNYMFHDGVPESRLYDNAEATKRLGLGVEIEADFGILSNPAKREKYRDYLRVGVEMGYINSIKMYYQDGGPGVLYNAYKSTNPYYHSVYDDTYLYAKGLLTYEYFMLEETAFTGNQGESIVILPKTQSGNLLDVNIARYPKYGTVRLSPDGSITYFPAEGFTGEDSFFIRDAGNEKSPDIAITIKVEKPTAE